MVDAANRLTSVTDWNLATVSYAYDDAGRMTAKTLPAGTGVVSSYAYDAADRLTGIAHVKDGQTTLASVAYTLDAVGNRTGRVDEQGTHSYSYDGLYRLTSVTYPGPSTTGYTFFDPFGNRASMTNGAGTTTYAYDDADRLTSVTPPSPAPAIGYNWDDNGNLTERGADTFAWDYEDRMVSATVNSVTTTFTYRGDGLRDSRTTGLATTTFTWDINAGLPVVLDDGARYLYGPGLEAMLTATATYYYLADGLGSTMAIVDSAGTVQKSYLYDVYGKPTATGALANEYDFAAQQTDPTGLQYLRARYMDPETGRFISRDLLAAQPAWSSHSFGYASCTPATAADPTGLVPVDSDDRDCGRLLERIVTRALDLVKRHAEYVANRKSLTGDARRKYRDTYDQRQANQRGNIREWRRRGCDDDFPDGGSTAQFINAAWEWATEKDPLSKYDPASSWFARSWDKIVDVVTSIEITPPDGVWWTESPPWWWPGYKWPEAE